MCSTLKEVVIKGCRWLLISTILLLSVFLVLQVKQSPGSYKMLDLDESGGPLISFNTFAMKSQEELLSNPWVTELRDLVRRYNKGNEVAVVLATFNYVESILNWLISACVRCIPPIDNVIILCLDQKIFDLLSGRNIPSVYIDPNSMMNITLFVSKHFKYYIALRLATVRILNSWGYDVVQYDSDAIILKNPQELFRQHRDSDIVSAAGMHPRNLSETWGFTTNGGTILYRSSPRTELLWDLVTGESHSDQILINNGLSACGIKWQNKEKNIATQSIVGECSNGLRVTILPHNKICRRTCVKLSATTEEFWPYVWHNITGHTGRFKMNAAKEGNVWWLRHDWKKFIQGKIELNGTEWLSNLMEQTTSIV